jgi:TnpA family transposase
VLLDLATARCVERKVLLPGVSVLARLVAQVRARAARRAWRVLAGQVSRDLRGRLESLLTVEEASRRSGLERLRRPPRAPTIDGLVAALERLAESRALGVGGVDVTVVPASRLRALASYGYSTRAQAICRLGEDRRTATLVASAVSVATDALDDAVTCLDVVVGSLLARVERVGQQERLRRLGDFDAAALALREVCLLLLDPSVSDTELRAAVFGRVPRSQIEAATTTVGSLAKPSGDHHYGELLSRYPHVRRFLPLLAATVSFEAGRSGRDVLDAWRYLVSLDGAEPVDAGRVPMAVVSRAWRAHVEPESGSLDRRAYTFCVLEALPSALRRRDVFVPGSRRFADPTAQLIPPWSWPKTRAQVCRALGRATSPGRDLAGLTRRLDAAYRHTAGNLADNSAISVETTDGRDRLRITPLDALEEPASLVELRDRSAALLPRVELPELLLEVTAWTGFTDEFTPVSGARTRASQLATSLCAVLMADACNIGWAPLARDDHPALTRDRLAWVAQNYLRAETLAAANARLVQLQTTIPLTQAWDGGEVASAHGLRFVVPVRSIHTGPNRRYLGRGRGVTYYNFTSDQFTGFHAIIIPGTLRDSLFILDGLLGNTTVLDPQEIMADTAGYSDVIFGLFWLLGYQFSPRLADVGHARFWRIDPAADYGPLDGVARNRINTKLITDNWDDLLRIAGSLTTGTVSASDLLRTLHGGPAPSTLTKAIAELGRIAKTLFLLAYVDDSGYRRRILTQLNRQEGRHALARAVFHGQRGQLRQPHRTGQEEQLGALGLVVNTIAPWNTRYLDLATNHPRNRGHQPTDEDVQRLSPLAHDHINLHGRYTFHLPETIAHGDLRTLREP